MEAEAAQFRESVVSKFATFLGTSNATLSRDDAGSELLRLIASSALESEVVCKLPCLDFRSVTDGSLILPKVGEHHHKLQANALPIDAALLPDSASATALSDDSGKAEKATAHNLGAPTFWTKSTLANASTVIERNLSSSFSMLVNARIREWTLLLLRQSVNAGDYASRSRLLGLLSATSELKRVTITFRALELPESARGEPTETDVVLPLLFRADLKIGILSHTEDLTLDAPGTISGNFAPSDSGLSLIEIQLNANALLDSMVEKARIVASRAVAQATRAVTDNLSQQPASMLHSASQGSLTELNSPRKKVESELAIPLTIREESSLSPRLQKIKSTAMRFSEVLEGKAPSAASGIDINRAPAVVTLPSAKVELRDSHSLETILMLPPRPSNNLLRRGTASKLKSFQSFGRPHGSDFQSFNGNATFANFGSINEPTWGRDGKLRRHPVPMQGGSMPKYDSFESAGTDSSKNAMFPSSPSSSADSVQMLSTHRPGVTRTEPKLSRTATALESWLMDSSKWSL